MRNQYLNNSSVVQPHAHFVRKAPLLFIALMLVWSGCCGHYVHKVRHSASRSSGTFAVIPADVEFASVKATGELRRCLIWYSIINTRHFEIGKRAYEVEFYVDEDLISFDRGSSVISPLAKIDFSCAVPLPTGSHTYRLLVWPTADPDGKGDARNQLNGTFMLE